MELLGLLKAIVGLVPWVASKVSMPVAYPFKLGSNIRALESATTQLRALKNDVEIKITNAERENSAPTNQAQLWLSRVETIEKQAEDIQQKYQQLCRCVCNISPNFCAIYKISRSAAKKHVEMKSLCDEKATIEVIIHMQPPLACEMPASSSISPILKSTLQYVKDNVHSIIGIWGMGGVGKTHLLKQINNELTRDSTFKIVVFVTCSRECSEEKIQREIIGKLGLNMNGSMEQKQSTIFNFLRDRSFVLLLDDLWSRVDLEIVGIPEPMIAVGACKRKVILTTRSTEVCGQMEVKKQIKVDVLEWDDAWSLFKKKVTEKTIHLDPLIEKYAMEVAMELGRLPLALITVGRAMHDKLDPREWEQAIVLLKKARFNDVEFSHTNQSVFHTLRFSYDNLRNETLKQCFLLCSLWPEDHCISKDRLIELWMGLGLIDEGEIQSSYNIGYNYMRRLQAVCLLEIDGDDTIKMHDVIRDMALWIANNQGVNKNKWIVQGGTIKEMQTIEVSSATEILSVMNNYARNVFFSTTCSNTKLSIVLLNNNRLNDSKTLQLELFSELTILDLSSNMLDAFPVEIYKLAHLQFLNLSCNPLKSLPEELAALINLKYLLLKETNCTFPNKVLPKLKALKVLDLSSYSKVMGDYNEIFPMLEEDLQSLPGLNALGITISNTFVFQRFSQMVSVPVRWLDIWNYNENYLSFASCFLGNSQLHSNLVSLIIRETGVQFVKFQGTGEKGSICHLGRLEHLTFQAMWTMKEIIWESLDARDVFPRLQVLYFGSCPELTCISWIVNLPCIRELTVIFCSSIKQLICIDEMKNSGVNVRQHSFSFLKKMILGGLFKLEIISDPMITYPALEFLEVDYCKMLKKLPFRTDNPPGKLKKISGTEEWWDTVEMEDSSHRGLLPFFKK